ncbi:MAG: quinolinate synthase NadA [Candidatus Altiarchaeota archaeon]
MSDFSKEILELKEEKNAVLLAHNYQRPEIQDLADYVGDSLDLAKKARAEADADLIVFAGVDFMAETAKILNPDKKVLLPDLGARCPMAAQLPAEKVREAKKRHPGAAVVLYINTLAEAKAEADIICTSANSVKVVESLPNDEILFGPDANLAYYVSKNTEKKIIPLPEDGFCVVHKHLISSEEVALLKEEHPSAIFLAHPECNPDLQDAADYILSTNGMVKKVRELSAREFIIGTEEGLCYRLKKENPDKTFIPLPQAVCQTMKYHTLEKIHSCLKEESNEVTVRKDVAEKALKAIERMLGVVSRD